MTAGDYISPEQAAEITGLSRWSIYRAIKTTGPGRLKATKPRTRWLIHREDLERWLDEGVPEPSGTPSPDQEHEGPGRQRATRPRKTGRLLPLARA
jgi:excisionase family DNA binding protein